MLIVTIISLDKYKMYQIFQEFWLQSIHILVLFGTEIIVPEIIIFLVPEVCEMVLLLGSETDKYWLFVGPSGLRALLRN